jgi:GNAT superfamily N-acetyltransferase
MSNCSIAVSWAALDVVADDGVVLIRDANTTIGYCRHTADGDIEYIFVNPAWRRRGVGRRLLAEVEQRCGRRGRPLAPISPLGRRFFGLADIPASSSPSGSTQ